MAKKPFFIRSIRGPVSALMLTVAAFGMMSEASAKSGIMTDNGATSCATCHTSGAYTPSEGQAGLKSFCLTKYPTKKGLYNTSTFVCIAPAPAPAPAPVTPTPTPTPISCGETEGDFDGRDDDDDDIDVRPTITAPSNVAVHARQQLRLAVTAFDCADRPIDIKASRLPKGATIVNSVDPLLQLPKAVISWTPSLDSEDEETKIVLRAVATDIASKKVAVSAPKTVAIDVLPPVQAPMAALDGVVKSNMIGSARFDAESKKLEITGQVIWDAASSAAERRAVIAKEKAAVITDANTGVRLGKAVVENDGKWRAVISTAKMSVPCAIDVTYHGKIGVKAVNGVKSCQD